jgi:hypothetical protein
MWTAYIVVVYWLFKCPIAKRCLDAMWQNEHSICGCRILFETRLITRRGELRVVLLPHLSLLCSTFPPIASRVPTRKSISSRLPDEAPVAFFSSGWRKMAQSRPRILVFARIWDFIHPASPCHPRPPGACSGSPEETKVRETSPARLVAPTCRRERPVVVLIASSSARYKSPPPPDA